MAVSIQGAEEVIARLNREIRDMKNRTELGMLKGAQVARGEAMRLTPVDTGNLKGSYEVSSDQNLSGPRAAVANHADYAPYVHENLEAMHKNGTAKFLEKAILNNTDEILKAIYESSQPRS